MRSLVAAALGTWAGVLWHQYVTDVGCSLGWRMNGPLAIASTIAVGIGVLGLVALLVRPAREARIAAMHVARRRQAFAGASLTIAAIVTTLAITDRLVPRGACVVKRSDDVPEARRTDEARVPPPDRSADRA